MLALRPTAKGGGGGASTNTSGGGAAGGSGGGGNNNNTAGGTASGSNTNAGGSGSSSSPNYGGGGGGGATAVGANGTGTTGGNGGAGLKYAASTIVYLSKKKDKNADGEVIGNIIHAKLYKGRFTKENSVVDLRLNYDSGLDPYYGLVDIAVEGGIFKKNSTRIELPDGSKVFEKTIYDNPEKYFTKDVLDQIEKAVYNKDRKSVE